VIPPYNDLLPPGLRSVSASFREILEWERAQRRPDLGISVSEEVTAIDEILMSRGNATKGIAQHIDNDEARRVIATVRRPKQYQALKNRYPNTPERTLQRKLRELRRTFHKLG
jgi:hypothetical protein